MSSENVEENTETKMQFILDENKNLAEIPKEKCRSVEHPIKCRVKNAFEVFVRVDGTENYWISNYGRCVNNLNRKDKNTFYRHKEGKVHLTVFEIERYQVRDKKKRLTGEIEINRYGRDTTPADLVADAFLVRYEDRTKVWHKDGDESNNWYKNLLTVTPNDYLDLRAGKVAWQELNLEQECIEYENKASHHAYIEYNGIRARCKDTKDNDRIGRCYDNTAMWQGWLDDPKSFVGWYLEHYFEGKTEENPLPLGVKYSGRKKKYYGVIQFTGTEKPIQLSEWDTPEEAFAEYKMMKQADILRVVAEYKESIPDYIYRRLLEVEVKPY